MIAAAKGDLPMVKVFIKAVGSPDFLGYIKSQVIIIQVQLLGFSKDWQKIFYWDLKKGLPAKSFVIIEYVL